MKKIKHKSTKTLRKKAWKLMSEYVRQRDKGICITCGTMKHWKEQQAGHYIHKDCLDFDFTNINCQCARCNKWLHGNSGVYGEILIKRHGLKKIEKLREKSERVKKWSIGELEQIISELQERIRCSAIKK